MIWGLLGPDSSSPASQRELHKIAEIQQDLDLPTIAHLRLK